MQTTTLLITSHNEIYDTIVSKYRLQANGDIATGNLDETTLIAIKSTSPEAITTIADNQIEIEKVIHIDILQNFNDVEFKAWDVVLPNSIIDGEQAYFLEYAPKGEYDLEKFSLILNGTIGAAANEEEFEVDMIDENIFPIATALQNKDLLSKTVVVRGIWENSLENTSAIVDMII